ncbi:hypothetical protein BJY59DRAFT_113508 [Rhodotorula toruloides]
MNALLTHSLRRVSSTTLSSSLAPDSSTTSSACTLRIFFSPTFPVPNSAAANCLGGTHPASVPNFNTPRSTIFGRPVRSSNPTPLPSVHFRPSGARPATFAAYSKALSRYRAGGFVRSGGGATSFHPSSSPPNRSGLNHSRCRGEGRYRLRERERESRRRRRGVEGRARVVVRVAPRLRDCKERVSKRKRRRIARRTRESFSDIVEEENRTHIKYTSVSPANPSSTLPLPPRPLLNSATDAAQPIPPPAFAPNCSGPSTAYPTSPSGSRSSS